MTRSSLPAVETPSFSNESPYNDDDLREGHPEVDHPIFWIDRYHPHSVRQHAAFAAASRAEVDAFHAAALEADGAGNGPPGDRVEEWAPGAPEFKYNAAFVLDPDGNNIEAVFRG